MDKDLIKMLENEEQRAEGILKVSDLLTQYEAEKTTLIQENTELKNKLDTARETNSKLLLRMTEKFNIDDEPEEPENKTPEENLSNLINTITGGM